jgi:hypothetical protein
MKMWVSWFKSDYKFKNGTGLQWLPHIILATQDAEIKRIVV